MLQMDVISRLRCPTLSVLTIRRRSQTTDTRTSVPAFLTSDPGTTSCRWYQRLELSRKACPALD